MNKCEKCDTTAQQAEIELEEWSGTEKCTKKVVAQCNEELKKCMEGK